MGDALIATPVVRIVNWARAAGLTAATGTATGWPLPANNSHVVALVEDPKGRLYETLMRLKWAGAYGWLRAVDHQGGMVTGNVVGETVIEVRTDWLQVDPGPFAPYEEGDAVPGAEEISKSTWTAEGVIPSSDDRPLTPGQALGAAAYDARIAAKASNTAREAAESAAGEAKEGRLAIVDLVEHVATINRALGLFKEEVLGRLESNEQATRDVHSRLGELDAVLRPDEPDEPDETPVETPAKPAPRKAASK